MQSVEKRVYLVTRHLTTFIRQEAKASPIPAETELASVTYHRNESFVRCALAPHAHDIHYRRQGLDDRYYRVMNNILLASVRFLLSATANGQVEALSGDSDTSIGMSPENQSKKFRTGRERIFLGIRSLPCNWYRVKIIPSTGHAC